MSFLGWIFLFVSDFNFESIIFFQTSNLIVIELF